jgi:hypothetical protein
MHKLESLCFLHTCSMFSYSALLKMVLGEVAWWNRTKFAESKFNTLRYVISCTRKKEKIYHLSFRLTNGQYHNQNCSYFLFGGFWCFNYHDHATSQDRLHKIVTVKYRARIFKCLWSPGIDSKEWIPPVYVAWRAGTITPLPTRFLVPIDCLKIPALYVQCNRDQSRLGELCVR